MTIRTRINALALAVIAAGTLGLAGTQPAQATTFDGCDDYMAARSELLAICQQAGYKRATVNGWCTSTDYSIDVQCG
jgi:hypothetical protein